MMSTVVEALYRNTIIDYMYRDVHNYPVINQCVISGVLTAEMENAVWECVCDNIYFIRPLLVRVGRRLCPYQRSSDC